MRSEIFTPPGQSRSSHLLPRDLRPVFTPKVIVQIENNDVFIEWNGADGHPGQGEAEVNPEMAAPWRSVISADRGKLNLSPIDQRGLYDLNSDPYEMTNRFDDPVQRDRVRDLSGRIKAWQVDMEDNITLPDP